MVNHCDNIICALVYQQCGFVYHRGGGDKQNSGQQKHQTLLD